MATSGSKSITVTSYDELVFSWSESSQSIANNTTTIAWTLKLIAGSSGRIQSSVNKSWSVTVNGTKYSGKCSIAIGNNETKTLASGTTTIAHNSDGTKTFSYSFSQQFDITFSGSTIGTKSGSGSGTLDTIARKSSLSASNGTLGTALNLTVSKQDDSLTHTITYKCGSASGTVCTKSSSTSVAWNTSNGNTLDLAKQNTTGTSVSVTFTITTYSGSSSLGSNTKTVTMAIPASVKPSCSVSVEDATGYYKTFGAYVQGYSKLKVTVTPTLAKDSPISSYRVIADGVTYTSASFTTSAITSSGTVSATATVTDKRGRSSANTRTEVTALAYSAPVISKFSVHRCDLNGDANDQGSYIRADYAYSISSLNGKNSATYQLQYKKSSQAKYEDTILPLPEAVTPNGNIIFAADPDQSYDIKFLVTDKIQTTSRTTSASTAQVILDFAANGKGIGVGKVCEFDGLDVGFPTRFRNSVQFDSAVVSAATRVNLKVWCFDDTTNTSYAGMARPDGSTTGWTRVTQTGLLPYEQGGNSSSLGSSGWPFKNGYFKNLYVDGNDIFNGSGWKTATLTSDFVKYDGKDENMPQYIKIGRLVEVRGAVSPTSAITGSADAKTIFTLPEGYRPPKQVSILSPGSGANQWLLTITAAGLVRFARYNNGAGYVDASTTTWLPFHAMYFVD